MSSTINITAEGEDFDVGDLVDIAVTTASSAGTPADPSSLVVYVQPKGQAAQSYTYGEDAELTRSATGVYSLAYQTLYGGIHEVRAVTTGDAGAEQGYFSVNPSNIT